MRKELSDFVKIKVLKKESGTDSDPIEFTVMASNSVYFEESAKQSDAGVLYHQSLTLIITKEESARVPVIPVLSKSIVELSDCDDTFTWGSANIPVEIVMTPRLEHVQFDMSCNSLVPLFRA